MHSHDEINQIIERNPFRKSVYDMIAPGSEKILDFGCNQGELLLRLRRDKNCNQLYGVEVNESSRSVLEKHLDGSWIVDISKEDADLGKEYAHFFNYIILHDVVEHLYDPWYVLAKLRRCIAPTGKLIVVAPNFQYWGFINNLIKGNFFYGSGGGLMNEDHIRWFTHSSLIELATLSGFEPESFRLLFPPGTDLSQFDINTPRRHIEMPPQEVRTGGGVDCTINFPENMKDNYVFFLANKILLMCTPSSSAVKLEPVRVGSLSQRRRGCSTTIDCSVEKINENNR